MRRLRAAIVGVVAVAAIAVLPASQALAAGSIDAFTVGGGVNVDFDDSNSTISFGPYNTGVQISAFGTTSHDIWIANVAPPTGTPLSVGTYPTSDFPDASHAGLEVIGNNGCSTETGSITISELARDSGTNAITAFAATYQYNCNGGTGVTAGELRWHSTVDYLAAAMDQGTYDFGSQKIGLNSTPLTVTVRSDGTSPVTLGTASLSGAVPAAFGITNDGCASQSLNKGQTCTVTIVAHPTAKGTQQATLQIPDNTAGGMNRALLSTAGKAANATVQLSPASLDFHSAIVGSTTAAQTVTVSLSGIDPVAFGTASIGGTTPAAFAITADTCSGTTMSQGQHCTISVTAHAIATDVINATLVIANTTVSTATVPLTVIGLPDVVGTYYPLAPTRILDTRSGLGAPNAALGAGGVLHLQVTGKGGVAAGGVSAVVLNVTVTSPTAASYLAVYPSGTTRPTVSNLNFPRGWTGANNVTVPVGSDGGVDIFNFAGSVQVIADVLGFYASDNTVLAGFGSGGQYQPVTPERLLDTRQAPISKPVPGGFYVLVGVDYGLDVNPHIRALAVNVTAVGSTGSGYLTTWPGFGPPPTASTLNFTAHATVPNLAIVETAPCTVNPCTGFPAIGVYNGSSGSVHIIVDIVGFYDDGQLGGGLVFHPITPQRIVDTRTGLGAPTAIGPKATAVVTTPGTVADANTVALAANVTAVAPTASTFLSVWPADAGLSQPTVSTVNAVAGQIVPNAALITIGPGAGFNIFNNAGNTNVLVDVAGVFDFESAGAASLSRTPRLISSLHPSFVGPVSEGR